MNDESIKVKISMQSQLTTGLFFVYDFVVFVFAINVQTRLYSN